MQRSFGSAVLGVSLVRARFPAFQFYDLGSTSTKGAVRQWPSERGSHFYVPSTCLLGREMHVVMAHMEQCFVFWNPKPAFPCAPTQLAICSFRAGACIKCDWLKCSLGQVPLAAEISVIATM
eukprot:4298829-Amphidinium_carterae.1